MFLRSVTSLALCRRRRMFPPSPCARIVLEPHPRMFPPRPSSRTLPPTNKGSLRRKKRPFRVLESDSTLVGGAWFKRSLAYQISGQIFSHLQWRLHAALGGDQDTSIRIPCIGPLCGYMLEQWTMFTVIYRTKGDDMGHAHLGHIEYPSEVDEEMPPNRFLTPL